MGWSCNSHSLWYHDLWPWSPDDTASDLWSWKHMLRITEDQNRPTQKLQGSISSPASLLFNHCQEVHKPRSSLTITTKGHHSNKIENQCIRPHDWFFLIYMKTLTCINEVFLLLLWISWMTYTLLPLPLHPPLEKWLKQHPCHWEKSYSWPASYHTDIFISHSWM